MACKTPDAWGVLCLCGFGRVQVACCGGVALLLKLLLSHKRGALVGIVELGQERGGQRAKGCEQRKRGVPAGGRQERERERERPPLLEEEGCFNFLCWWAVSEGRATLLALLHPSRLCKSIFCRPVWR